MNMPEICTGGIDISPVVFHNVDKAFDMPEVTRIQVCRKD